ncbi:uracil-DNA glycosylase family protein [Commensalibacter nepenthis]|uniref:Uracil-DNA glycosylase family protein n=1 Tax=Commensalibacter nepenthis TaxID=3043872 RepID=A0ABT6Q9A6_9PROT|nr:uracil-DNA glycosylase family protein [Commensalibacter sp. TBRC 10068]MDI2112818.1 uracil-DNA glycosylase family protein [Commensalibacter sp. TBRC 10068]
MKRGSIQVLEKLLQEVEICHFCERLPFDPKPILQVGSSKARLLITGQAPGTLAHETRITFNNSSGDRLREWLQIDREIFYNPSLIAIVPMGFCYLGKLKHGGDLPPRKECAPRWWNKILQQLSELQMMLLVGSYAQNYVLGKGRVTNRVKNYKDYLPNFFVCLIPRGGLWLGKKEPIFLKMRY